jgi:hypothetical protein
MTTVLPRSHNACKWFITGISLPRPKLEVGSSAMIMRLSFGPRVHRTLFSDCRRWNRQLFAASARLRARIYLFHNEQSSAIFKPGLLRPYQIFPASDAMALPSLSGTARAGRRSV